MVGGNHSATVILICTTASLSLSRAKAPNISVVNKYFNLLQSTMDEYDLHDKHCQLFNVDETGMPLNPKPLTDGHLWLQDYKCYFG